jgi:hypothetical protein
MFIELENSTFYMGNVQRYYACRYYCGHGILDDSIDVKLALGATNLTFDFCNFYHTDMPKINFQMSNSSKRQS